MRLTLITSNISAAFLAPPGVPPWDERKLPYAETLRAAEADLIGLQEATPPQFDYMRQQLPLFSALSVPVDDPDPSLVAAWRAKYAGFGLPDVPNPYELVLFYRTAAFELLSTGHWWLSPTPERPSIGFGNTAPRAVLWARLRHRESSLDCIVFNTHIDRRCPRPMVDLCRQRVAALAEGVPAPVFMGDLNFNPADPEYQLLMDDGWRDAAAVTAEAEAATFLYDLPGIPGGRIDHILSRGQLAPLAWRRLLPSDPARRISDHDPVCATLQI